MKGLLALFTYFVPDFANDGLYTLLYTVADGFFYFLPVALAFSAARKFRMNEFTGVAIGGRRAGRPDDGRPDLGRASSRQRVRARRRSARSRGTRPPREPHHHARLGLRELGDSRPSHGVVRLARGALAQGLDAGGAQDVPRPARHDDGLHRPGLPRHRPGGHPHHQPAERGVLVHLPAPRGGRGPGQRPGRRALDVPRHLWLPLEPHPHLHHEPEHPRPRLRARRHHRARVRTRRGHLRHVPQEQGRALPRHRPPRDRSPRSSSASPSRASTASPSPTSARSSWRA